MRQGSIERAEQGGTLGARADLAAAMTSGLDYPAQAAGIRQRLAAAGVPDGASVLAAPCRDGGLLEALGAWYDVAGCDPHGARIRLAAARLPGVPLWRADRDDLGAAAPFDAVIIDEAEALGDRDLAAALEAALEALAPSGVLLLLPGPEPDELPAGAALMDTHDGEGLKIVSSSVVRRSGDRARLQRHWMVARDEHGVEMFSERHTLHLHTPEVLQAALSSAGIDACHHPSAALQRGLWQGVRYSPGSTGV